VVGGGLGISADDARNRIKALGGVVGRPWAEDQKTAALAAWRALATG